MPVQSILSVAAPSDISSVEVSGWDALGQFFVEVADLDLDGPGDIAVRLDHRVRTGSVVFVRIVQSYEVGTDAKSYPAASEVQLIEPPDANGRCRIRLVLCQANGGRRSSDEKGQACI